MKTPVITLIAISVFAGAHAQVAATSQPTPAQQQPCNTAPSTSKPSVKVPPKWKAWVDNHSPISTDDLSKSVAPAKPSAPCPPAQPNTQLAPVIHLPVGVISTWLCNPIITSTDASHTTTFITPDVLTSAEPTQANAFEADAAKADAKATVSCANLRRDPRNKKVFLAQQ